MAANAPRPRPVRAGHPRAGGGVNRSAASAADLGANFWHAHIAACDPVCVLLQQPVWAWDPIAFAVTHALSHSKYLGQPDPASQRPAPHAAPSQPPDPDSDDTEP